jgi:hypothetical protein
MPQTACRERHHPKPSQKRYEQRSEREGDRYADAETGREEFFGGLTEHRSGTVRPVLASIQGPTSCSERYSNHFSDGFLLLERERSQRASLRDMVERILTECIATVLLPNYKCRGTQISCPPL